MACNVAKMKDNLCREFAGGLLVRIPSFQCLGPDSDSGQGTEILQASWCSKNKKKKNKQNKQTNKPYVKNQAQSLGFNNSNW